eukprot:TRINITY_DN67162_c6_g1_i6.p3 TRINITY_DN67162_c6_g1~~TRINITY_DN67162_c6_g1_i6.p3  ORF type:complete len:105 (-),score=16.50 TRINITY_DN67162_c6_g1_i6:1539-1853(-)
MSTVLVLFTGQSINNSVLSNTETTVSFTKAPLVTRKVDKRVHMKPELEQTYCNNKTSPHKKGTTPTHSATALNLPPLAAKAAREISWKCAGQQRADYFLWKECA